MPAAEIRIYCEPARSDGEGPSVPLLSWLADLENRNRKAFLKCVYRIGRLKEEGHDLRRPEADVLRDGVYELRVRHQGVNYRILYGFVGKNIVLLSHGLTKEKKVPPIEIDRAVKRLSRYKSDPKTFSVEEDLNHG